MMAVAEARNFDPSGQPVVDVERLEPRFERGTLDLGDLLEGIHQGDRATARPPLHPVDRFVLSADAGEVDHQQIVAERLLVGHDFEKLYSFGPAFPAIGDIEPVDVLSHAVEMLGVADAGVLAVVEVWVGIIEHDPDGRHVVPVGDHKVIVVAAADARSVQQEIEGRTANRRIVWLI